jgi:hypothetical protein
MGVVKRGLWVQRLFHFFYATESRYFAVVRKVLIWLNALLGKQASGPTRLSRRSLPCKALVTQPRNA